MGGGVHEAEMLANGLIKMKQKQKKWYWLQLEVDHKVELSYNSLEDINYFNKNI